MPRETISYKNEDIDVIWRPGACIHSRLCWTQLRAVFDPSKKPWVNMEGAATDRIIEQVKKCPSRALSFEWLDAQKAEAATAATPNTGDADVQVIACQRNGPLEVTGKVLIKHSDGTETMEENVWLCRCGGSKNKPFCDNSHLTNGFRD